MSQQSATPSGTHDTDALTDAAEAVRELAEFVAETSFDDLPPTVKDRARLIVADTVGVAIRGSREPEMIELHGRLAGGTGARLLCAGFPEASAEDAAFANATSISFLELDEGSRPTGHPALHVLPAALAAAQADHRSGPDLICATVLGYEVQSRLAAACQLRWPVHPHGNLGNAAAVAALGKLAAWPADLIETGMNAGASLAAATSWTSCLVGATTRNAYAGISAKTAFAVRLLVESGFTASAEAITEAFGVILGDGFDSRALTAGLGDEFGIERSYFKFHATCALVHPALDALADALDATYAERAYPPWSARTRPPADGIERVRVWTSERGGRLANLNRPNQLSAKFSIPHAVAAYIVYGDGSPSRFVDEALRDATVRNLAERVEVSVDEQMTQRWPAEFAARVVIELQSGETLVGTCANPYGSGERRASRADLEAKFLALSECLGEQASQALWDAIVNLESVRDVAQLLPPGGPGPA